MKTNRILLVAVALVLVAALTVTAGEDKWAKMKAELSLTDAQVAQLEQKFAQLQPITDKAKALKSELAALESAATPNTKAIDATKAELSALKKEWKPKAEAIYKSVLSKEQFAKYEAMQAGYEKSSHEKKH
jgi:chromosome segregation ATPase